MSLYPLSPCGLAFRGSQDGPPCPGQAVLPLPVSVILQGVFALPHSLLSLTSYGLGRGATPTFLFPFQGLWGKECDQARRPEPLGTPCWFSTGWSWRLSASLPHVFPGTLVLRKAVGIKQDDSVYGAQAGSGSPQLCTHPSPSNLLSRVGGQVSFTLIEGRSAQWFFFFVVLFFFFIDF